MDAVKATSLLLLVLLLAACGGGTDAVGASGKPEGAAPTAGANGPPAAWIEAASGGHWLGFSSYCWSHSEGRAGANICADYVAPECGQKRVPDVRVDENEAVRVHLGFDADEASVEGAKATMSGRVVEWRVQRAGPFAVFAKSTGGDASYVGCAVFS